MNMFLGAKVREDQDREHGKCCPGEHIGWSCSK